MNEIQKKYWEERYKSGGNSGWGSYGMSRFKSAAPTTPLGLVSASGGKGFGTGSVFWGEVKTFCGADGRFSGGINWRDDGWKEKEKRIPLIWTGTRGLGSFLLSAHSRWIRLGINFGTSGPGR